MEPEDKKDPNDPMDYEKITIIDLSGHDSYNVPELTSTYAADTITISPTDWSDINMGSNIYSVGTIASGGNITNAVSGSVLTSGSNGTNWGTITFNDSVSSSAIHINGDNPVLKTDAAEININELAGALEAIKQIMDTNELPIFDRAFRDKHEILQKAWEDIKQAYENYRLTEALLKSPGPGDDYDE
jgi:hypothetical protein